MRDQTKQLMGLMLVLSGCQSAPKHALKPMADQGNDRTAEKAAEKIADKTLGTETVTGAQALSGSGSVARVEVLRLVPGEDVRASLDRWAQLGQIQAASILSAVGSLSVASIRFAEKPEAVHLKGPFEVVSLSGVVSAEGSHAHIAVSDRSGKTVGGHLGQGSLVHTTLELVLGVYKDMKFNRSHDSRTGYKELFITPIGK